MTTKYCVYKLRSFLCLKQVILIIIFVLYRTAVSYRTVPYATYTVQCRRSIGHTYATWLVFNRTHVNPSYYF